MQFFKPRFKEEFVGQVFLVDSSGIFVASDPPAPEVMGKNFAFRDWYKGVMGTQYAYLSEVYKRAPEPQYNVVTMAMPIIGENQRVAGIVGFQMRIDHFKEWSKTIGTNSLVIVDQYGHIVAHPQFLSQGAIADFYLPQIIKDLQVKKSGAEIIFNPVEKENQVIAYALIPGYNWGMLIEQSSSESFIERSAHLWQHTIVFSLILLWCGFLVYLLMRTIEHFQGHRKDIVS
ncbi:MAG: cache domain-containing protein [bacterium]|nr:cache domain-containing protein [bacterium]